ncbi:hypothetical protein GCM10025867_50400 (plasmid) [Frondihabitans sucicola]|uniref:Uncharacterized protein n=1 Tax=Frondihabitans sucicola TaxID=1268041 RepID=A0ABM8GWF9_9MICO|nr:hypothetical protein [Frondihabitans sucicola]BDZ52799.1 hypothetical protein GCM10025867_50400 [Frondihabitans sucicola]
MSHNETETGTILLLAPAVAQISRALVAAANAIHDGAYEEARAMHRGIKTTSLKAYAAAVYELQRAAAAELEAAERSWSKAPLSPRHLHRAVAISVLFQIAHQGKLHAPTHADIERIAPKATNRTDRFEVLGRYASPDAYITLRGRELGWESEGNHAVDQAHEAILGRVLFETLKAVKWTRTSGGALWYNSEHNEGPSGNDWGGGDSISEHFGPLGKSEYKRVHGWYPGE